MNHRFEAIVGLYRAMPGAPMPPKEDGSYLWGEVGGNDHWTFCEAIVELVEASVRQRPGADDIAEQEKEAQMFAFFKRVGEASAGLQPGEGISLYGPPGAETSVHFSRIVSQFDVTVRGQPPAPHLKRLLYTVTKNDSVAYWP